MGKTGVKCEDSEKNRGEEVIEWSYISEARKGDTKTEDGERELAESRTERKIDKGEDLAIT